MFRLYRKSIYPRWHYKCKNTFEKKSQNAKPKVSILYINSDKQNHSNGNRKKQHADKQDKRYWDDPHCHFNFLGASVFETAGWLGTVAVCVNYHLKHINTVLEYEKNNSSCLFSNIVHALPRHHSEGKINHSSVSSLINSHENRVNYSKTPGSISPKSAICELENDKGVEDADIIAKTIKTISEQYSVAIENSVGVRNINKDDKKAFRSFQNAARHGSSAGFYNLGLCYQLGKGTRVNLNMAAYCYRRAAMKGHGLASFNLAVFFYKGIGGLPVDIKIANELLAEAAEKNIPEAQLYFGILFLEEKRWSDAVKIFSDLAEKNVSDAQYYLGVCYENGLGVPRNGKMASELFRKSAEHGNKKASDKLQNNRTNYNSIQYYSPKNSKPKDTESSSLHSSTSVPELGAVVKKTNQNFFNLPILSYLNLFTPLLIVNKTKTVKDGFYVNEKLHKEYSSTCLSFKTLPAVVMEVKSQL